jgi:hypothetical protein
MKKFFVSIGMVAAGAASLQAAYAPGLSSMQTTKLWSLSGTLRGFYDGNYDTTSTGVRGSYGFEVSPTFSLNVPLQQTEFGLNYTYGLYYYQDREEQHENPIDQTHELDLWVDHAFSEDLEAKVLDSFVVGQEPELLAQGQAAALEQRADGDNIANTGTITVHKVWTRLFSTDLGYQNIFSYYQQHGGTATDPSLAGTLNRIENVAWLNLNWQVAEQTTFLVGGQFDQTGYIGDEPIAPLVGTIPVRYSNSRDSRSYEGYVGVQHNFLPNLSFAGNVGIEYTEYYNDPLHTTALGPYAVATLTYTYSPGSYAQIGVNHSRNATDQVDLNTANGSIALDQESSLVYASINQMLTAKLLGSVIGQVQYSTYNGGTSSGQSDVDYGLGVNLNYTFTPHFSAEAGYNYDLLQSGIAGLGYSRNRVYVGVTAAY